MQTPGHSTLESMSQALWYNRWTMKKFSRFVRGDILEVGCGIGNFTPVLAQLGRLWAIDIDRHGLRETKRVSGKRVRVGWGDIEKGRYFFRHTFDSIICMNVLEHIQDDSRAIRNIYALVKPDGYVVVLVPVYQALYGSIDEAIYHFRRYSPKDILTKLTHAGFRIVRKRRLNFLGAIGWWVSGKLLKRATVTKRRIALFNRIAPWVLPLEDVLEPPIGTSILIVAKK